MTTCLKYFAYGSNLHPKRLQERIKSSRLIAPAELQGHTFKVHKRGIDDSAKCNAFYTGEERDRVLGALFEIDATEKTTLDHYEDEGRGYQWTELELSVDGRQETAFSYLALPAFIDDNLRPFDWYKELVLIGMRYHGYPEDYIHMVNTVGSVNDPDRERAALHRQLILRLQSS